jgi:hypothetical protein
MAELSIYEPTVPELEAAEVSPDALIGVWAENLRTLDWIPWRDDETIWGIDYLPAETEARLSDPEKHRQGLIESTGPCELVDHEGYVTSRRDLPICVLSSETHYSPSNIVDKSGPCHPQSRGLPGT